MAIFLEVNVSIVPLLPLSCVKTVLSICIRLTLDPVWVNVNVSHDDGLVNKVATACAATSTGRTSPLLDFSRVPRDGHT
jgi:hypothetical protein